MFKQDDSSENERLLLSATFTTKFELFFVLTKEDALPFKFYFEATERAYALLKHSNKDFTNSPPFERSTCFYVTATGNFERFQYFNLGTNFLNKSIQNCPVRSQC